MAKKFVGTKTLEAFMQIVKTALGDKVDVASIVTTLESEDTNAPLAASQGKVLKEMIEAITGGSGSGDSEEPGTVTVAKAEDANKLGGEAAAAYVMYKDLVTTLEGYDAENDAEKAVAVALVKALQDQINALVPKDEEGNPVVDENGDPVVGVVDEAKKLDGLGKDDFVQRTDVVADWADYNEDAEAAQVVAAALIKSLADKVNALVGDVDDGKSAVDRAIEELEKKAEELKKDADDETKAAIDEALQNAKDNLNKTDPDNGDEVNNALKDGWDDLNTSAGKDTENPDPDDVPPDVTVPPVSKVALAEDAEKLGGQVPEYYASKNDLKTAVDDQKGEANGIAPLGDDKKIPSEFLPSYVDDVIEVFMVNEGTSDAPVLKAYADETHETVVNGEKGKIYVDVSSVHNDCYRWSGSTYIKVAGSEDMVEITAEEIQAMWDEVVAEAEAGN